jgi:hypothetical protein
MIDNETKRLQRIERYFDLIKHHLYTHNLLIQEIANELADLKHETPEINQICISIRHERESLETLRNLAK